MEWIQELLIVLSLAKPLETWASKWSDTSRETRQGALGWHSAKRSLPDDLHQHPLASPPVELPVEDLLPRPQIQPPCRIGYWPIPLKGRP